MKELTDPVIAIAEDMMKSFPDQDRVGRRAIIQAVKDDPSDKLAAAQLLNQTRAMFEVYPYAEKDGDDEALYRLRMELK